MARSTWEEVLNHEVRRWSAEEENARRHQTRIHLVLTLTGAFLAFLGYGLFRFPILSDPGTIRPPWMSEVVKALTTSGTVSFVVSLWLLLASQAPERPWVARWISRDAHRREMADEGQGSFSDASFKLILDDEDLNRLQEPDPGSVEQIRASAATRMSQASNELARRNVREKRRIDRGQQWFLLGFSLIILALLGYLWFVET